eukprot:m.31218 g.31218  ORF g.31218 m.31218 type:complete len:465 (+) comp14718_c0_seq2:236-1630(+)
MVPLEIVVFGNIFCVSTVTVVLTLLLQHEVCMDLKKDMIVIPKDFCDSSTVTGRAANWNSYCNLAYCAPAVLIVSFLGTLSDRLGRKPFWILSSIGPVLQSGFMLIFLHFKLPLPYILVAQLLYGFSGSFGLFLQATFSSVADVHKKNLSLRMSIMEGVVYLAVTLGGILAGVMLTALGFFTFFLVLFIFACFMLLLSLGLKETFSREKRSKISWKRANVIGVYVFTLRSRFIRLVFFVMALLLLCILGQTGVFVLYGRHLFHWSNDMSGFIVAAIGACKGIGMAMVLPILMRMFPHMTDYSWLQFALLISVLQNLMWMAFPSNIATFSLCAVGLFNGFTAPIARSILSKLYSSSDQGTMFAAVAVIETACGVAGPIIFNEVYSVTVSFFPQTFFGVQAALFLVQIITLGLAYRFYKHSHDVKALANGWVTANVIEVNTASENAPLLPENKNASIQYHTHDIIS